MFGNTLTSALVKKPNLIKCNVNKTLQVRFGNCFLIFPDSSAMAKLVIAIIKLMLSKLTRITDFVE